MPAATLPYALQHAVLPPLQALLEAACHRYMAVHMPQVLRQRGWTVAPAAELQAYTREILAGQPGFLPSGLSPQSQSLALRGLNEIRHVAVHRTPLTAARLLELVGAADRGARALGDPDTLLLIGRLRERVNGWLARRAAQQAERERLRLRLAELDAERRRLARELAVLEVCLDRRGPDGLRADVEDLFCSSSEPDYINDYGGDLAYGFDDKAPG